MIFYFDILKDFMYIT